jgi:hypothetical protein
LNTDNRFPTLVCSRNSNDEIPYVHESRRNILELDDCEQLELFAKSLEYLDVSLIYSMRQTTYSIVYIPCLLNLGIIVM